MPVTPAAIRQTHKMKPLSMTNAAPASTSSFISIIFLLLIANDAFSASQKIITDDGREVLLDDDGTWIFNTTDRFANTKDGRRVRLKEDGNWLYVGAATAKSEEQKNPLPLDIKLQKVVIEKYEKKTLKNTRVKTRTAFYLQLKYPIQKNINVRDNDISLIEVRDNNGKNYPVLSIKQDTNTTLIVRADKSPSILDDAKSMQITLKAGAFGIETPITLSQRTSDFDEVAVDGFD